MAGRLVVVGGGAAGMSAASAARRVDRALPITVCEAGPFPSYGVCGIPYFLAGVIAEPDSLIAYPADEFRERRGIDLRLRTPVTELDLTKRTVTAVTDGTSEQLEFDRLIWATGASPIIPPVPGIDDPRVVTVRTLGDAISLRPLLAVARRAVVVGAGYVGLEAAEALAAHGIDVTIIDRLEQPMGTVDPSIAELVAAEVGRHAQLLLSCTLIGLTPREHSITVHVQSLDGPADIDADLVVLALGVRPSVGLLADAGAETGPAGALRVDPTMATSLPGVWAAGDAIAVHHRVLGADAFIPLGPAANKTGRVAGTVAAGGDASFEGVVGSAVVKVFDLEVAHTGLSLEQAHAAGIAARATEVTAKSRAKYYPGAAPMAVRLVYGDDGVLLGGQLAGTDGVAQRVDILATALHTRMTVTDLSELDLAYAPPFSPVYDPITQAANAALWSRPTSADTPAAGR